MPQKFSPPGPAGDAVDDQARAKGLRSVPRDDLRIGDLVFFDTTSIYFEGEGGQSIGQYGFSKDHRPDPKQMIVGLAVDIHGWPICSLLWPGNTTDSKSVLPLIQRFQKRFRVKRVSVVADRGMISKELIAALESEALGCQYILGVRMRSTGEVEDKVLRDKSPWMEIQPERERTKDPSPLKVKEVRVDGRRYVVCLNEEQRRKDVADREAIVAALRDQRTEPVRALRALSTPVAPKV